MAQGEVLGVPVEDSRDFESAGRRVPTVAAAVGQEAGDLLVQLRLQPGRRVRFLAQHRAAHRGAVEREVDARVVVAAARAQLAVLDVVERQRGAQQRHEAALPGALQERAQLADGGQPRVARQHQLDRERVVGVDQERLALCRREGVEGGGADGRQRGEIGPQRGPVGRHGAIAQPRGATAVEQQHMAAQQRGPGCMRMVERRVGARPARAGGRGERTGRQQPPAARRRRERRCLCHSPRRCDSPCRCGVRCRFGGGCRCGSQHRGAWRAAAGA